MDKALTGQILFLDDMSCNGVEVCRRSGPDVDHLIPERFIAHFIFSDPSADKGNGVLVDRIRDWLCDDGVPYHIPTNVNDSDVSAMGRDRRKVCRGIYGGIVGETKEDRRCYIIKRHIVFKIFAVSALIFHQVSIQGELP